MSGAYINIRSQPTATGGQKSPNDSCTKKKEKKRNITTMAVCNTTLDIFDPSLGWIF